MIQLKDGTMTRDPRLDCLLKFDPRSRNHPVTAGILPDLKPVSKLWACARYLNQGDQGACVGAGITHELIAEPMEAKNVDMAYAHDVIYWGAQRIDEWPGGSYPGAEPQYEGTSVLAGCKVAKQQGWIESYKWSFDVAELIMGVGHAGPAVLGLPWLEGMMKPDREGHIRPTGRESGRHCILCRGVDIVKCRFQLRNSWGRPWGVEGDCYVSFEEMADLLHRRGEAVFFIGRKLVG